MTLLAALMLDGPSARFGMMVAHGVCILHRETGHIFNLYSILHRVEYILYFGLSAMRASCGAAVV